jgi:hypothetical protein
MNLETLVPRKIVHINKAYGLLNHIKCMMADIHLFCSLEKLSGRRSIRINRVRISKAPLYVIELKIRE